MTFRELHRPGDPFVLANAWDIGSARMLVAMGAKAVATTSAGFAFTRGLPDGGEVGREEAVAHGADLDAHVPVPVSADLEDGYGPDPADAAETVRQAGAAGLAGCCIEDVSPEGAAYGFAAAVARVENAVVAARAAPADHVFCARADGVMHGLYDLDEAIRRLRAFREAGADHVALAGYMRILGDEMVGNWAGRMLNIHPSLLPLYPGLETHARAIEAGDTQGGASVHLVIPELDAGEVLGQIPVAIREGDTPSTLAERVKLAEHQLYPHVLGEYVSRGYDADYLLAKLTGLALALPQTEEKTSHGSPAFKIADKSGKFFAHFSDQHHGVPHISVLAKTSGQDELLELCERNPDTFYKPAYYGASGWVGIVLNRPEVDWEQVEYWLERSWRSVAPKRLSAMLPET